MAEKLECDLVMRGGITSGIVYPRAIAKLAETYNFRSIGGTSAGAIAATATAAAAYAARNGKDFFQTRIKTLPQELATDTGGKTVLERLFQPAEGLEPLFGVLMASLQRGGPGWGLVSIVSALYRHYWKWAVVAIGLASIPFALSLWLIRPILMTATGFEWVGLGAIFFSALIFILAFGLIGTVVGVGVDIFKRLPANGYGLCTGSGRSDRPNPKEPPKDSEGVAPLTDFLHELFQSVAGKTLADDPVTFGDLWRNGRDETAERDIDLVLMTTNATRGVSHRFPFLEGQWGPLYVNEKEFSRLFPPKVVEWMKKHKGPKAGGVLAGRDFFRLPAPADLPILLGARMSLSFPFLLSAVPLFAPTYKTGEKAKLRKFWFSDGGITSNFPIHFFDGPLPSRPTFGINLVPASVDVMEKAAPSGGLEAGRSQASAKSDPWQNVWMPTTNSSGVQDVARFNDIEHGNVIDFFMMLFDTARNWGDTELMAMPGYRDRIVHVSLAEDEGGLNLNMPREIIAALGDRGERAGMLLAARFAPHPGKDPKTNKHIRLSWDNHRWVRYRSMMAAIEDLARRFQNRWGGSPQRGQLRTYAQLLMRGPSARPQSYPFVDKDQREFAAKVTNDFLNFVAGSFDKDRSFDRGESSKQGRSPRPKPRLRVMPPGSNDPREERFL
jgi:Patatin-like phospholipase